MMPVTCSFCPVDAPMVDPQGRPVCEDCLHRKPFYVNVFLVDRSYGGPEEGGWTFDHGEPVASHLVAWDQHDPNLTVPVWDAVEDAATSLQDVIDPQNEGRPPISSVASEGIYVTMKERHFARPWPGGRPRYE